MKKLVRCRGVIGRGTYFAIGATLLAVKIAIDWSIARLIFERPWSPVEYSAPGFSLALLFGEPQERRFYLAMLLVALPFIYAGVSLTAMRLRSVGLSAGWSILFFLPGINFAMFALLLVLPRKSPPLARLAADVAPLQPSPHSGPALPLEYGRGERREWWIDQLLPTSPLAAKALAVFVPALIAMIATYVSIECFTEYGWGVFVAVPFGIGMMSEVLWATRLPEESEVASVSHVCRSQPTVWRCWPLRSKEQAA